jgi:hypothetical protein
MNQRVREDNAKRASSDLGIISEIGEKVIDFRIGK